MNIHTVILTKRAKRDLQRIPVHLVDKFQIWVDLIENQGVRAARKIKSYHDEPLLGKRKGQRSIRLNKAYRAIYCEKKQGYIELIEVQEVNKHDY